MKEERKVGEAWEMVTNTSSWSIQQPQGKLSIASKVLIMMTYILFFL